VAGGKVRLALSRKDEKRKLPLLKSAPKSARGKESTGGGGEKGDHAGNAKKERHCTDREIN